MTRRIAIAILLTVWATLVVAGGAAYLGVRAALVADLDAGLVAQAARLPELVPPVGPTASPGSPAAVAALAATGQQEPPGRNG
ncbi:MAG TPA: hypothetical protein VF796_24370, partial [Humisphaera sp.]